MAVPTRYLTPLALVLLGTLLLQAAWILAVPPFRGSDELDHAYRADAVAHGHWAASSDPPKHGRGGVILVRSSIVEAAGRMCSSYGYTGPDNCRPISEAEDGMVRVASGASGYHPVYYFLIGTPALIAEGARALIIMRVVSATLCLLMLGLALHLLTLIPQSFWLTGALVAGLTPVLLYSTAMAAPNGLEMAAGAATWAGLLALAKGGLSAARERRVVGWVTLATCTLATLRQLGPLWLALIFGVCVITFGWRAWIDLARRQAAPIALATAAVTAATIASVWWVRSSGTLVQSGDFEVPSPIKKSLLEIPLWVMQSIAAFPLRNEQGPVVTYAVYGLLGLIAISLGALWGDRRIRAAIVAVAALSVAVPFAISVATLRTSGDVWQGRYTLPFSVGLLLACALTNFGRGTHRLIGPLLLATGGALIVSQVASILQVYTRELQNPAADSTSWPVLGTWELGVVATLGGLLWLLGLWRIRVKSSRQEHFRQTAHTGSSPVLE